MPILQMRKPTPRKASDLSRHPVVSGLGPWLLQSPELKCPWHQQGLAQITFSISTVLSIHETIPSFGHPWTVNTISPYSAQNVRMCCLRVYYLHHQSKPLHKRSYDLSIYVPLIPGTVSGKIGITHKNICWLNEIINQPTHRDTLCFAEYLFPTSFPVLQPQVPPHRWFLHQSVCVETGQENRFRWRLGNTTCHLSTFINCWVNQALQTVPTHGK